MGKTKFSLFTSLLPYIGRTIGGAECTAATYFHGGWFDVNDNFQSVLESITSGSRSYKNEWTNHIVLVLYFGGPSCGDY